MLHIHKYGPIIDGYQYCVTCNKANLVPCQHKWEIHTRVNERAYEDDLSPYRIIYVNRCKKCGDLINHCVN